MVVLFALFATACGGDNPSSPDRDAGDQVTEAQVSSEGSWRGTFGERGAVSGTGIVGSPFIIGQGRQCATVSIVSGTTTRVRVGKDLMTLHAGSNPSGTVCGAGLIGSL
jgi:hypothetical protein